MTWIPSLQMQDLPQAILAALAKASGPISSLDLASKLSCDVQKVVGAVKSLEVLEGYIETEMVAAKRSTSIILCTVVFWKHESGVQL